jgi:hypothetical protein
VFTVQPQDRSPAEGAAWHRVLAARAAERAADALRDAASCGDPELLATHLLHARQFDAAAGEHRAAVEFLDRVVAAERS